LDIIAEGIEVWSNGYFRGIRRHLMLIHWRTQKRTIIQLYNQYPLLCSLCLQ